MLVFDTKKQYNKLILSGFEKYPNRRDLTILCKEWLNNGTDILQLKQKMMTFCKNWNSQFNYAKYEQLFLNVISHIKKEQENGVGFEFNSNIKIYKKELLTIKSLQKLELQKIAFIILSLAKWRNANYIYLDTGSSIKLKDIFTLCDIKSTKKQQMYYLFELNSVSFIDVQLKPLLKLFIPCIQNDDELEFEFEISDNMINEYIKYTLPHCEKCGNLFEKKNNKQKYCCECAKIVLKEQKLKYWNKTRKTEKQ